MPQPLTELPPHAIVAADHPLAQRGTVSLQELADDPYILLDLPYSRDYFFGLFRTVGSSRASCSARAHRS